MAAIDLVELTDPRVKRTREALHAALESLLAEKEFEKISIQDIAQRAQVNRVTFYDHYPSKFQLLECVVAGRFMQLMESRQLGFDGTCTAALRGIVLAVFDFLAGVPGSGCTQKLLEPHMEGAVLAVLKGMLQKGIESHPGTTKLAPSMVATAVSWAIYGAAREWIGMPSRPASEQIADDVVRLIRPLLTGMEPAH